MNSEINRRKFISAIGAFAVAASFPVFVLADDNHKTEKRVAIDEACENLRMSFKEHMKKCDFILGESYVFRLNARLDDGHIKDIPRLSMKIEHWSGTDEIDRYIDYIKKNIDESEVGLPWAGNAVYLCASAIILDRRYLTTENLANREMLAKFGAFAAGKAELTEHNR